MTDLILAQRIEKFTILTLNRPEKRNALNMALLEQLCASIEEIEQSPDQHALIITGSGSAFCAGMDLQESADLKNLEPLTALIAKTLTTIYTSRLVTIAAVNGSAIAGGAGIMSACDFVIAVNEAQIGYPEIRLGLVAAQVATLLVRQVPWRKVRELLLLGEFIDAKRALEMGLINQIVSSEEMLLSAVKLAEKIAKNDSETTSATKRLLAKLEPHPFEDQLQLAVELHRQARLAQAAETDS